MFYKVCVGLITLAVVAAALLGMLGVAYWLTDYDEGYLSHCLEDNTVVVVPIYGDITWGVLDTDASVLGSEVVSVLDEIAASEQYVGVIFDVDSPGGYPVASSRLAEAVYNLTVPTVAVINDLGTSGGYLVASAADWLIAHPVSDVGNIGVTASYVDESAANEAQGYAYESLSTGAYKDVGDPARPLSDEERDFLRANLVDVHQHFVEQVATYRDLDPATLTALEGKWFSGTASVELGLIDETGGFDDAWFVVEELVEIETTLCYAPAFR